MDAVECCSQRALGSKAALIICAVPRSEMLSEETTYPSEPLFVQQRNEDNRAVCITASLWALYALVFNKIISSHHYWGISKLFACHSWIVLPMNNHKFLDF